MIKFELNDTRVKLIEAQGHLIIQGGPGSGKTTIALLKAQREIQKNILSSGQRVLFLSFSRATIARVIEQVGKLISERERRCIEVNTYHGFIWNILQSHGYLLKSNRTIRLLPPPEASSRLAEIPITERNVEKKRLFSDEGLLHFDLFADISIELLSRSKALTKIICKAYPIIILDEFQDTDAEQWEFVKILGKSCRLIALADPEQRIYEFRGADPRRIGDFITAYSPTQFDFGTENNRSNGTDIAIFGNDLITGANKGKEYKDVEVVVYQVMAGNGAHLVLKTEILQACKRLRDAGKVDWSIAVLLPSKNLMLDVSDFLSKEQKFAEGGGLPVIHHDVALDGHAAALASVLIARVLESADTPDNFSRKFIEDLRQYLLGRNADKPTQADIKLAASLRDYLSSGKFRKSTVLHKIINESLRIANQRQELKLSGSPREDWIKMGHLLIISELEVIKKVVQDATFLRLLNKGSLLSSKLGEIWRSKASYEGSAATVHEALVQEHFSASVKQWKGINVMTIHKSKGKEFDEVLIYEGFHHSRIHFGNDEKDIAQSKLKLRVAVTRAKIKTTILTPRGKICELL